MYMYNRDVNNQLRDQSLHPITHIHDWSPYWLFTSLLHKYMTGLFTGYLHHYDTYNMTGPLTDY
jgi:hypothetical protein